jgi:hypothetical protein
MTKSHVFVNAATVKQDAQLCKRAISSLNKLLGLI